MRFGITSPGVSQILNREKKKKQKLSTEEKILSPPPAKISDSFRERKSGTLWLDTLVYDRITLSRKAGLAVSLYVVEDIGKAVRDELLEKDETDGTIK